ncbi:hypothetical protein CHLRE_04g214550v5 [Chlamydomonas reinhardtii]|uniref:Uncharacterized protein n=1 Tax=Chlamydomonas reinhardtii TaxID=3055 RepID=A8J9S6_CHLRE|nr:uncharacterized protein CHLRE_04g214550v5 [Chlamydomonas reinhardtii]PNW83945.1 hypothetical protein CHLRE_04g214550v5 [Chlamydomonas reinhardtii]|eukprot:XP_001698703.1 predicted protein [Chlamydomonas reinhardtii]
MALSRRPSRTRAERRPRVRSSPLLLLAGAAAALLLLLCASPSVHAEADTISSSTAAAGRTGAWGLLRGGALPAGLASSVVADAASRGGGGVRLLARRLLSPWVARGVSRPICNSPAVLCSSAWSLDGNWVKASYKIAENEPKAAAGGGSGAGRGTFLGAAVSRG